ncbi:MAG TPA: SpoIIE family protein phosphatase [Candidatus Ozemobacteraceae bacterium]|nr:SpoIIE family protein phosphatase [Candidatus Ozemobacteraceae bacterium]
MSKERIRILENREMIAPEGSESGRPVNVPFPEDVSFDYLESLVELLNLLADDLLAARMMDFRARIRGALSRMAGFIGVDAAFLWVMDDRLQGLHDALVSSRDLRAFPEWNHLPALQKYPALVERLEGKAEAVSAVLEGPPQHLRGYLMWPIMLDGRMRAVLGFSERNVLKRWTVWERQLLQLGGTVFRQEIVRQRSEQVRRHSELRYRLLASHYPNGMVLLFDREMRFLVAEGEAGARWGLTPERLEGRKLNEVFPAETAEKLGAMFQRTLAGETIVDEMLYLGETIEMRLVPVRSGGSTVVAGMLVTQIITERKQAEASLRQARQALEEARRQEAEIASEIQRTLLFGRMPSPTPVLAMDVVSIPSMEVDGDFYDVYSTREHICDIVLGDVMGKGTPAALIGAAARIAFLRSFTRLLARGGKAMPDPEAILGMVHGEVSERLAQLCAFITLVFARIDVRQKTLQLINCGHPPVLVHRAATGELVTLESTRPPLGIGEALDYSCVRLPLNDGDLVVILSDGVSEARNEAGEMFGAERLHEVIRRNAAVGVSELVARIRDAVRAFVGKRGLQDDFTCLIIRLGS